MRRVRAPVMAMRAQSAKEPVQGVRRGEHLPARSDKEQVPGVRRGEHLPARSAKEQVQGVRRGEHLPARSEKEPVQGMRRGEHLPARSAKEPMQGVQRGGHLPARSDKEPVQGLRRGEHLPSKSGKEPVQGFSGAIICQHNQQRSRSSISEVGKPVSIIGGEAGARHAKQTRTSRCRRISRSSGLVPHWLQFLPAFGSRRCKDGGGAGICQHNRRRSVCKGYGRREYLPAQSAKEPVQGGRARSTEGRASASTSV